MTTNQTEASNIVLQQFLTKFAEIRQQELPEYMTTPQAAAYLGLSKQRLDIWRCNNTGPVFVKLAQAVRYKRSDLDAFMAAHTKKVGA